MKKTILWVTLLVAASFSSRAQELIDIQFGGNDFNGGIPTSTPQTGVGLTGSSTDSWNNLTDTSALTAASGVGLNYVNGHGSGATLTVFGNYIYPNSVAQYSVGPGGAFNPSLGEYGSNALSASSVGNLAQGFLADGASLSLSFTNLAANTSYAIYLLSAPNDWSRTSSWSVNGGTASIVGPQNSYTGNDSYTPGYAPYDPVLGINYLVLSGTTNGSGDLTLDGTSVNGKEVDINGLQLQKMSATPEPSTYALLMTGIVGVLAFRFKRFLKA